MTDTTSNLLLPLLMPQQAQKSVTHNQALEALDAVVMLAVVSRTLVTPPAEPTEGDRYIIAAGAAGGWSSKDGMIAAWQNGAWAFFAPREGWLAWCTAEVGLFVFHDSVWQAASMSSGMDSIPEIGINTTADTTNRLAVASAATLLTHDGSDHRLVVNKQAAANTASLLLQDNFSGRAEIGLAGDDNLAFKVSADGSTFLTALKVDNTSGAVAFPATNVLTDYAVNLYQDSGRLAGNGVAALTIGAFAFPSYLTFTNGGSAAAYAKFIYNNSDNGGTAGNLDSAIKDLINQIRSPASASYRRYGPEFWAAKVTAGSGTSSSPQSAGGKTGYINLLCSQQMILPAMTFHVYLRALTEEIIVRASDNGQSGFKNGVAQGNANFLVAPADGWASVTIQQKVDPYTSLGYQPLIFSVYAQAAGDQFLLACPALMGGIVTVNDKVGLIPAFNGWPA
jgi:hypothetical protein